MTDATAARLGSTSRTSAGRRRGQPGPPGRVPRGHRRRRRVPVQRRGVVHHRPDAVRRRRRQDLSFRDGCCAYRSTAEFAGPGDRHIGVRSWPMSFVQRVTSVTLVTLLAVVGPSLTWRTRRARTTRPPRTASRPSSGTPRRTRADPGGDLRAAPARRQVPLRRRGPGPLGLLRAVWFASYRKAGLRHHYPGPRASSTGRCGTSSRAPEAGRPDVLPHEEGPGLPRRDLPWLAPRPPADAPRAETGQARAAGAPLDAPLLGRYARHRKPGTTATSAPVPRLEEATRRASGSRLVGLAPPSLAPWRCLDALRASRWPRSPR